MQAKIVEERSGECISVVGQSVHVHGQVRDINAHVGRAVVYPVFEIFEKAIQFWLFAFARSISNITAAEIILISRCPSTRNTSRSKRERIRAAWPGSRALTRAQC